MTIFSQMFDLSEDLRHNPDRAFNVKMKWAEYVLAKKAKDC